MMQFSVNRKTGFNVVNPSQPVTILDENRQLFYDTSEILPVYKFNVPEGNYYVSQGSIARRSMPVIYSLYTLPIAERFTYPDPSNFEIIYGSNPDKCTVHWNEQKILCDPAILTYPKYMKAAIIFHEMGHRFYSTEKYCDLYAANCMLNVGFTPFQVMLAFNFALSDRQPERKDFINKKILKSNGQKAI